MTPTERDQDFPRNAREEAAAESRAWQDRFTMNGDGEWILREGEL